MRCMYKSKQGDANEVIFIPFKFAVKPFQICGLTARTGIEYPVDGKFVLCKSCITSMA